MASGQRTATSIAEALLRDCEPLRGDDIALTGLASAYIWSNQRIAELEAEVERLREQLADDVSHRRVDSLLRELAAERAKRCETCRHYTPEQKDDYANNKFWEPSKCEQLDPRCSCFEGGDTVVTPPPDFACNRWEAK